MRASRSKCSSRTSTKRRGQSTPPKSRPSTRSASTASRRRIRRDTSSKGRSRAKSRAPGITSTSTASAPSSRVRISAATCRAASKSFAESGSQFRILELSRRDKNLVVSHKEFIKERERSKRKALFDSLQPDQEIEGVVRSVVDFGLFVDIGGFEGLVHRSEIAWKDLPVPPSEYKVGTHVNVRVIDFDREKGKVSLSIKRLRPNPWSGISERYAAGRQVEGKVVSVTDFGAFVELEQDVEGLVHVTELSWGHPENPKDVVKEGDAVPVVILSCDEDARRISLSLRRTQRDPWENVETKYARGHVATGAVTKITDFGAFVKLEEGVEGLVHVSEIDWGHVNHPRDVLKEGDAVQVKVLSADPRERRISLSIRELKDNPWRRFVDKFSIDDVVEGVITEIKEFGAFMKITDEVDGLIHVSEISNERIATPADVLAVGQKVQAKIIGINEEKHQVRLSMRNLFGPPEVPAVPSDDEDRDRGRGNDVARSGGGGKERPARARRKSTDASSTRAATSRSACAISWARPGLTTKLSNTRAGCKEARKR